MGHLHTKITKDKLSIIMKPIFILLAIFFIVSAEKPVQETSQEATKSLIERGKDQLGKIKLPEFKIPEFQVPEFQMPDFQLSEKLVTVNDYKNGLKKKLVEISDNGKV